MADTEVVTSNSVFEILEEWEEHLKASGFDSDEIAVEEPQIEEPQP